MKIGIVGCGALGCYYGAMLGRDGHDVHFLLRSDFDVVKRRGVSIKSPNGDFNFRPIPARIPEQIGPCELVLIGLKTTANDRFAELIPPLVDSKTAVMTLQNGLGNEDALANLFPREQILGGLCFVCLNRTKPGQVQHIAHGKIVMGEFAGWPEPRTHGICTAIKHAGVPCIVTAKLERAHWEKLIWNIPFNGLGVAGAAGFEACISGEVTDANSVSEPVATDVLLASEKWESLVRELMNEVIATGQANGFEIDPKLAEKNIEATRVMGAYRASTLIDFERGLPLELDALFLEPLKRAKQVGVDTPRLESLCEVLQKLDPKS
ncbi:MAG: 2-dehydropantoate 2-reductase [Verrucomicrobiales bacterium]|nr:2-dehydropantoate 2-reductase [Verrucomicrobiales bacterium]|tara:strand:- start:56 stop:1021 length:966 start_codon:yes stop_codon:yes gene_type:complete